MQNLTMEQLEDINAGSMTAAIITMAVLMLITLSGCPNHCDK